MIGVVLIGFSGLISNCSLEGSSEFSCGTEPDETLFENPPIDTAFVKLESSDPIFARTFRGIRKAEILENPVEGIFENLQTYEREAEANGGRLFGLGTQITDAADSAGIIIAFNLETGSTLIETCRSTKVFQAEHNWSRWQENLPGIEIVMTLPIDGKWVNFTSDTSQEDGDIFELKGAEFLDSVGFYARLSGSFTVTLKEEDSSKEFPEEIDVAGSFILNMRVSR